MAKKNNYTGTQLRGNDITKNIALIELAFDNMLSDLQSQPQTKQVVDKHKDEISKLFNPYGSINPEANNFKQMIHQHLNAKEIGANFKKINTYLQIHEVTSGTTHNKEILNPHVQKAQDIILILAEAIFTKESYISTKITLKNKEQPSNEIQELFEDAMDIEAKNHDPKKPTTGKQKKKLPNLDGLDGTYVD